MTRLIKKEAFDEIVSAVKSGAVVAFPTDTVFGLGVIYSNYQAVENMKAAKGRDEHKPFPLMVASASQLSEVAFFDEREKRILEQLTPGALTLVLKKKDSVDSKFTNGFDTIAIRIPDDEFVLKLLNAVGPMFVTSANISGQPSCNYDYEVLQQLNNRADLVVEGQAFSHVASTIIDCTGSDIVVLRQGDITIEDINKALTK